MNKKQPILNEAQRSSLTITLRLVEETLKEIEELLAKKGEEGILYAIHDDLNTELRETLMAKIQRVRGIIHELAQRFRLKREEIPASRLAFGKLPSLWEMLVDEEAQKLRRYGEIAQGLENELDPDIKAITAMILEMQDLLAQQRTEGNIKRILPG